MYTKHITLILALMALSAVFAGMYLLEHVKLLETEEKLSWTESQVNQVFEAERDRLNQCQEELERCRNYTVCE